MDVSDTLNTPSVIFASELIVSLATTKPAEFIVLRISQGAQRRVHAGFGEGRAETCSGSTRVRRRTPTLLQ